MSDDLLALAERAVTAYFTGEFKTKLSIRQCMSDLRVEVQELRKKMAREETARLTNSKTGL